MREEAEEKVEGVRKRRFERKSGPGRDSRPTTKQLHDRLLRALSGRDSRFRRSFGS